MKLSLIGHDFKYELEKLVRIFFPFEKIEFCSDDINEEFCAITKRILKDDITELHSRVSIDGKSLEYKENILNDTPDYEKECERILAVLLYRSFTEMVGYLPPWGILTGVRPAKLYSRLRKASNESDADKYFSEKLLVSTKKIELCKSAVDGEDKIIGLSKKDSFSLYISIPFCPTRCSYCSFVSHSIGQAMALIPKYVELLCREIEETGKIARDCKLRLETIYIGGGTPTSLSAEDLKVIMQTIANNFDLSSVREYTVEAGRPDTITKEKLLAIKSGGATRISINPQTMNDAILEKIGRKHTSEQTIKSFLLARECGFDNINMDLIAGLPEEDFESFKETLDKILLLSPESVTVHSLSIKRASNINANGSVHSFEDGITASKMVEYAKDKLALHDIVPYYMYRQSKTVGNLENVGYSKKSYECLYNVFIMDETHSILACGASAVTKLREPDGNYIERIFNFKYPYEYINRFDEIISRKSSVLEFYKKHPAT